MLNETQVRLLKQLCAGLPGAEQAVKVLAIVLEEKEPDLPAIPVVLQSAPDLELANRRIVELEAALETQRVKLEEVSNKYVAEVRKHGG